jgi:beta-glucosidase
LADGLVAEMTLDEKAGQMAQVAIRHLESIEDVKRYHIGSILAGGSDEPPGGPTAENWAAYTDAVRRTALKTRLEIPLVFGIDAVHGMGKALGATIFPHNIGLGCTRDAELVRRIARITAVESRGCGVDWIFAPVLAAARDERWGRTYEAFGETPSLAAELGAAAVLGLQDGRLGEGRTQVLACAKHFAGDGATAFGTSHMEGGLLDRGDAVMSLARFREIAVSQFAPAIDAGVGTVMVSYSSFGGKKMHGERHLLTAVLKEEMGFMGFVVSDWKGIDDLPGDFKSDIAEAVNAGVDMVMLPDRYQTFVQLINELVPDVVPGARIDDAVRRILTVKCEMGLFRQDYTPDTDGALTKTLRDDSHRAAAREAVQKSLVLLKNRGGLLPLKKDINVHVAGPAADDLDKQCGGWTVTWMGKGSLTEGTTVLQGIKGTLGIENVTYSPDGSRAPEEADVAIAVIGEAPYAEWKGDRDNLALSEDDVRTLENLADRGISTVVILISGRPMIIAPHLDKADALVAAWLPGTEGAGVADVLFGDVSFTGKLSHSWPRTMDDIPINFGDTPYNPLFPFGFGLSYPGAAGTKKVVRNGRAPGALSY